MKNPLIIIGAGASYDFLKIARHESGDQYRLNTWRPPLTNNVFDVSRFSEIIGKYENVKPLASTIINIVDGKNPFDFEKYLSNQEVQFPEKSYPQIIALRFYLAELFSKVSYHFYRHTNNHTHLIDQIDKKVGKAVVVNFNYDTLFEKNIPLINNSDKIDSYIDGTIKVIKIHGAHNWRYTPKITLDKTGVYEFFISGGRSLHEEYKDHEVDPTTTKSFDYSKENFDLNEYRKNIEDKTLSITSWLYYLPAIAIPIATKASSVCPPSHIKVLTDELASVDGILVVGWRAQDEYVLKLLKDNLPDKVKLTIVSSSEAHAQEIALKFKEIQQIKIDDITVSKSEGYTNFMINGECEQFFK